MCYLEKFLIPMTLNIRRGINNSFLLHLHRYYVFHLDTEMIVLDGDLTFKDLTKLKISGLRSSPISRLILIWVRTKLTNYGSYLSSFLMFSPGIKEIWDVTSLGSMWLTPKAFLLAKPHRVGFYFGEKHK